MNRILPVIVIACIAVVIVLVGFWIYDLVTTTPEPTRQPEPRETPLHELYTTEELIQAKAILTEIEIEYEANEAHRRLIEEALRQQQNYYR